MLILPISYNISSNIWWLKVTYTNNIPYSYFGNLLIFNFMNSIKINDIVFGFGSDKDNDETLLYCAKITKVMDWEEYKLKYSKNITKNILKNHQDLDLTNTKVLIAKSAKCQTFFKDNDASECLNDYPEIMTFSTNHRQKNQWKIPKTQKSKFQQCFEDIIRKFCSLSDAFLEYLFLW